MAKFERALAAWPQTTVIKENGGGVHITGRYVQPGVLNDICGIYVPVGGAIGVSVMVVGEKLGPAVLLIVPTLVVGLYWLVWRPVLLGILRKNVDVKIFPETIQVRRWFSYKNYSRTMPMEFRIEQHQRAPKEAARGSAHMTYRQAVEVVMWYGENRVVIAAMPQTDMQRAQALVFRLQNVVNSMDALLRRMAEDHTAPAQASEFGPAPEVR